MTAPRLEIVQTSPVSADLAAWKLVLAGQLELVERGFAHQGGYTEPSSKALLLLADGEAVSIIAYLTYEYSANCHIHMSYTLPQHRKRGYHTTLWTALCGLMRADPTVNIIASGTHVNNVAMQERFRKQGRVEVSRSYEFELCSPKRKPLLSTEDEPCA